MEPRPPLSSTRKYRVLTLDEATRALIESRPTLRNLQSWMTPFFDLVIAACDAKKKSVTLQGKTFELRKAPPLEGMPEDQYFLEPVNGFVPCATFSLSRIKNAQETGQVY